VMIKLLHSSFLYLLVTLISCNEPNKDFKKDEMKTVEYVDIDKFMGDWYVIANIPTFIEKEASNAIESYKLDKEGNIATTFTFFKNSTENRCS